MTPVESNDLRIEPFRFLPEALHPQIPSQVQNPQKARLESLRDLRRPLLLFDLDALLIGQHVDAVGKIEGEILGCIGSRHRLGCVVFFKGLTIRV